MASWLVLFNLMFRQTAMFSKIHFWEIFLDILNRRANNAFRYVTNKSMLLSKGQLTLYIPLFPHPFSSSVIILFYLRPSG